MYDSSNPLSAISYTNKDFQTIYPELLETVKKLTYKWDPTISNESDPGVILLKLNAIIADKNNYNIDKNVLENYPETYTQMLSARSQYRQLGYRMPWYRAATTTVRFKWVDTATAKMKDGQYVVIPKYTTITDSDNDKIFTTLHDVTVGRIDNGDGTGSVEVIQGVVNTLTIAGNQNITLRNLDSQNRLYISDYNIAENGIFITNTADSQDKLWEQVDNVEVQVSGTLCYEFDVDARNNVCYIQFPDDIDKLIGSGLTIRYVITRGYDGNVGTKIINKFYQEPTLTLMEMGVPVPENNDVSPANNLMLYNSSAASNGADPETIEQAYKSYKHVVATFNTLVTLRDYMNALYQSGYVSNAIVTDRTNDIQSTIKIVDRDPVAIETHQTHMMDDNSVITLVEYNSDVHGEVDDSEKYTFDDKVYVNSGVSKYMSAFDLKFYLLSRGNLLTSMDEYDTTFDVDESATTMLKLDTYLSERKSLQHDIKPIQEGDLFMLQNVYPIRLKIVPTHKLSEADMNNIATNIQVALRELLNAHNVEFGAEPLYDVIYDTIANSDERIKVVIMDDFSYTTYAVYADKEERTVFKEDGTEDYEKHISGRTIKKIPINNFESENIVLIDDIYEGKEECDVVTRFNELANILRIDKKDLSDYVFIDQFTGKVYLYDKNLPANCNIYRYSDKVNEFRLNIVAKNVLAGVTPLYDPHTTFKVSIDMQQNEKMSIKTDTITTSLEIAPFGFDVPYDPKKRDAEYTLGENENLRFLAPSFVTDKNYSNYVKYELVMKAPTGKEEYVYADPDLSEDLLAAHGNTNFYRRNRNGDFEPVNAAEYQEVSGSVPKLKLDCYFEQTTDSETKDLVPYGEGKLIPTTENVDEIQCWAPEFEPFTIYRKDEQDNGVFKLLTSPPVGWENPSVYKQYYRLKQFYPEYSKVLVPADEFMESTLEHYTPYSTELDENGMIIGPLTDDRNATHYLRDYDPSLNYFEKVGEQWVLVSNINPADYQNAEHWGQTVYTKNLHVLSNMVITNPQKEVCYTNIGGQYTNMYRKVVYTNPLKNGRNLTFYEMVYADEQGTTLESFDKSKHTILSYSVSNPNHGFVTSFEGTVGQPNNSIAVRYVSSGRATHTSTQLSIPHFEPEKYYTQSIVNNGVNYSVFTLLHHIPMDWNTNYSSYFIKSPNAKGLGFNSPEYTQWKAGALTLYVKERTYKVPANTDYQLREGDYITFFWRESDDDDAPYQYIKYNHIYDEDNGLPTIIRPNFNITASSYSNCKFDPRKQLQSSNVIPYDAAESSDFQRIYLQLVTDYDLSGTKQIDLRKMNSRALDNTNHIYFITRDVRGDDFYLTLRRSSYSVKDNTAVYTYTLQNDEYFVYTNAKKDAFEVLGAGTLIKLTRKFNGNGKPSFDDDGDNSLGTLIQIKVPTVKISDVMFYGIDTFKNQCVPVTNRSDLIDSWLLIEQQIYSFTQGDTIIIHMDDSEINYIPCDHDDPNKYAYEVDDTIKYNIYDRSNRYEPFNPAYLTTQDSAEPYKPCMPPFVPGVYYQKVDEGNYQPIYEQPQDWEGRWEDNKNKYYVPADSTYSQVNRVPEDFSSNHSKYFTLVQAKYPVYKTNYSNEELETSFVRGYTVHYKSNDSVAQQLPSINVVEDEYQWNVTATLNLNFDKDHAQKVLALDKNSKSKQIITIGNETFNSTHTEGDENVNDAPFEEGQPLYLMSDVIVDKIGGSNVDVTYVTADSEDPNTVEIMAYQLNPQFDNLPWGKTITGEVKYTINPKDVNNHNRVTVDGLSLGLAKEDGFGYILPVYTYNGAIKFQLSAGNGVDEAVLEDTDGIDDYRGGVRYYKLNNDTTKLTLSYTGVERLTSSAEIVFGNLFKFRERELYKTPSYYGITQDRLEEYIKTLDVPKCFKYTHVVDDSIKIEDPLNGQSFFDVNHVHNQFTIAKGNIRFARNTGAKITFVNNR